MNRFQQALGFFVATSLVLGLNSCDTPPPNTDTAASPPATSGTSPTPTTPPPSPDPATPSGTPTPTGSQPFDSPSRNRQTATANTVTVTIYQPDNQCQTFVPEKVAVPADQPIQGAVGKVVEQRDTADFSIAGYRVNVTPDGTATVDFRLAPNSTRQFRSLSSCEQMALFGSLRQTLTSNPQWNIDTVRFTEQGQDILL